MNSSTFNQTSKSRFGERIAAWKGDVRSFFDDDWSRLRTLMMDLEEAAWSDEFVDLENHTVCDATTAPPALPESNRRRSVEPAAPRDRLAELAEQLERRLRTSNRGR